MQERFSYDPFVLPYTIGLIFVVGYLLIAFLRVVKALPLDDKKKLLRHIFSWRIFQSLGEIFMECLLHRKIWRKNKRLGYMHFSLAFGWFMLIVLGHIEVFFYAPHRLNLPYFPIFFRYFMMETEVSMGGAFFFFLMDFFLLMVLTGVGLAIFKRFRRKKFGMVRTTKLRWNDQIAVYSLWAIFPLRFLAESFTSSIGGGSFLTRGFGLIFDWFNNFVNNEALIRPTWWAYSIALGVFFFVFPGSRFTHILSEVLLIILRNAGIREEHKNSGYGKVEIYSCSRCGICLDPCQLVSVASLRDTAAINYTRNVRLWRSDEAHLSASICLMCNRCTQACPVGVNSTALKLNTKRERVALHNPEQYNYIPAATAPSKTVDTLYFAGCMTHLTPSIKKAMLQIFDHVGEDYRFMDEDGSICCGRPVLLAGAGKSAEILMQKNREIILQSGAKTLVTSCPICFKFFRENYALTEVRVLHHSQYIREKLEEGTLHVQKSDSLKAVFHDPCELGRNSGVYRDPRQVLEAVCELQSTPHDGKDALCCGHSIAAEALPYRKRRVIAEDAAERMFAQEADVLVTACPACKKAFVETHKGDVKDLAEIVAAQLR